MRIGVPNSSFIQRCMLAALMCAGLVQAQDSSSDISTGGFQQGFLNSLSKGTSEFPHVWEPYLQRPLPSLTLQNSPRLTNLIHDGKIELSLANALALTLENNLDIVVERYVIPFSQIDILRTKSGQAARGFTGSSLPGELNSGAIGAGVTGGGGTGGTGSAGGITGGGGAVTVGAAGAFDPTVSFSTSFDHVTSPLNSTVVTGKPVTTSSALAYSSSYAQAFTTGTSFSVSLSTLRQNTTQLNTVFNPDVTSRLSIGVNQPLLAGFGRLANERFMIVARNNLGTAQEVFRQQVITSVAQVAGAYYDLAQDQLNVQVAQQSVAAAQELVNETRRQEEVGTQSRIDVTNAESQLATSQATLVVAQTNVQQQSTLLKQLLSKVEDPALDAATIEVTDALPQPRETDLPDAQTALSTALANRPEINEAQSNLKNQDIAIEYAKNNQRPSLAAFGLYAGSGLEGNSKSSHTGSIDALGQSIRGTNPEGAVGMTFAASVRNRSAQADSIRAQLERNQQQISLQNTRNQINLQLQQARVGLIQGRAQVDAAREATRLAIVSRDAEQEKLRAGLSTAYNVVLKERDVVTAQYTQVQLETAYAKALVAMDQAMGTTLERNGIRLEDAVTGTLTSEPTPAILPASRSSQGAR